MGDIMGCLIFWVIAFIVLAILEAISVQLIAIWFAVGSLAAFIAALMNMPFWMQMMVFLLTGILLLGLTRPLTKKFIYHKYQIANSDCIVGKIGTVIEKIDNGRAQGRIAVNGSEWAARSCDDTTIPVNEKVTVESVDGVKVMVTKLVPQKLPES